MKKRVVALMLGTALVVSALVGCGSKQAAQETAKSQESESTATVETAGSDAPETEETAQSGELALDTFAGTEITVGILKNVLDKSEDYSEKTIVKMAEEETGIKVNFVGIDATTKDEKVSVLLANTEEMPDMMIGLVSNSDVSSNLELFYDLSEEGLLETYAPNVYADYMNTVGLDPLMQTDGSIRTLMTGGQTSIGSALNGILWINQTWLDQLGMEVPTTMDEFYEVLCAFRDNDLNGNGDTTDEIPYLFANSLWCSHIYELAGFWGIAGGGSDTVDSIAQFIEDGEVKSTADTDNFRAYLEYVNMMVEEGLIDKEGFSQTYEQFVGKVESGDVGCFWGWTPHTYMDKEKALNYTWMAPVAAVDGVKPVLSGKGESLMANTAGVVFNAESENVQAALWWWNYLSSSTENKWTANNGPEGTTWEWKEGEEGKTVVNRQMEESELPSGWNAANCTYSNGLTAGGIGPYIRTDELAYVDFVTDPTTDTSYRFAAIDALWDYKLEEFLPTRNVDADASADNNFIWLELEPYLKEFIATSMMEGVTDESWEAHLEQLNTLQYYEWLDWYQKYYDGEL